MARKATSKPSSKPPSSRPKTYAKKEQRTKFTPTQIKRVVAAGKMEYSAIAKKYEMPLRTARRLRKEADEAKVPKAEIDKLVQRLLTEACRFCLDRKRSYKNSKKEQPTKELKSREVKDFMEEKHATYNVEKKWLPKHRKFMDMLRADKAARNPDGHTRKSGKLPNGGISQGSLNNVNKCNNYF
jgi:hypothetical protein